MMQKSEWSSSYDQKLTCNRNQTKSDNDSVTLKFLESASSGTLFFSYEGEREQHSKNQGALNILHWQSAEHWTEYQRTALKERRSRSPLVKVWEVHLDFIGIFVIPSPHLDIHTLTSPRGLVIPSPHLDLEFSSHPTQRSENSKTPEFYYVPELSSWVR